jgi:hypothetical protein
MTQVFVFFHKFIFDDIYKDIPQDILNKYFTFVATNENVKKQYTEGKYNVINEWELPIYDPQLQKYGYNENSGLYHIYKNKLHEKYTHVGFLQYDMSFGEEFIKILEDPNKEDFYAFAPCDYDFVFRRSIGGQHAESMLEIIEDYEKHYNTKVLRSIKYPLYNTYLINTKTFTNMMEWFSPLLYKIFETAKNKDDGGFGGLFERAAALNLGDQCGIPQPMPIRHDHDFKHKTFTN